MTLSSPAVASGSDRSAGPTDRYLELLKSCLTRELSPDENVIDALFWVPDGVLGDPNEVWKVLHRRNWRLVRPVDRSKQGQHYIPPNAETMVGRARLDNVQRLVTEALAQQVPGDLVETGVWRGGTAMFMRAILAAHGCTDRLVWACDSFEGLPTPDPGSYPEDASMLLTDPNKAAMVDLGLSVSLAQVKDNFRRYDLLDDQVRFVEGWFRESLPAAPIDQIAVLRLDGDYYESTMDALVNLEPKVSPGGYVIIDDYGALQACRAAVTDYRAHNGVADQIEEIDWTGVFWRKSSDPA